MLSLFVALYGQQLVGAVATLVATATVGAAFGLVRSAWKGLVARGAESRARIAAQEAEEKRSDLARLADFAGRAAHMLNLAVLASPEDAERIASVLDALQADMTAATKESLEKHGWDALGVRRLIVRSAAGALPGQVAGAAAAAGVDPQAAIQAAADGLLRATGLAR